MEQLFLMVFKTRVAARNEMDQHQNRADYLDLRVYPNPSGAGFVIGKAVKVRGEETANSANADKPGTKKKAPKVAASPALQRRHQEEAEAAVQGKLPKAPDFSADSRARYRPKLKAIAELVKAKDVKALKALAINPVDSANRIMLRYRNNAITALEAKA